MVKNPPANTGDVGLTPGLGRSPGEGNGQPSLVFLPGKSHRQRSLAGYSPWYRKESDMTKQLNTPHSSVVYNNREYIWCLSWVPGPEVQKPLEFPE